MTYFLLVDDHVVVRAGIKTLLSRIYKPAEIHEAFDGDSTAQKLKETKYDLIILDIQMPNTDSMGLLEYIVSTYPDAKVLIFSMSPENIYAIRFIKKGAMGFVSKEASLDAIINAINVILTNKKYVSPALATQLAKDSLLGALSNPFNALSPKEFEIVSLLISGKTVTDISQTLHIHTSTVGTHKSRSFEKLGVSNLLELKSLSNLYNL